MAGPESQGLDGSWSARLRLRLLPWEGHGSLYETKVVAPRGLQPEGEH